MNRIRKIYIQSISIAFTCTIVSSAILNIARGYDNSYDFFIIQLLAFLVINVVVDSLLCKTSVVNKYSTYLIVEGLICFVIFLLTAYLFHWFGFRTENIIRSTFIFVLIYAAIQYHFYKLYQQEADQINQML
ncbi:MAG TPA: DUF3021 family protein, partial [Lachnospiraceae bacterium]|nr:DUF3021 family protein [Lachnospiraceae bacterium]